MDLSGSMPDYNVQNCLNYNYFDKLFEFIGENEVGIWRQRYKVKITDQSEALFKQKR